jgi:hypothetical protein
MRQSLPFRAVVLAATAVLSLGNVRAESPSPAPVTKADEVLKALGPARQALSTILDRTDLVDRYTRIERAKRDDACDSVEREYIQVRAIAQRFCGFQTKRRTDPTWLHRVARETREASRSDTRLSPWLAALTGPAEELCQIDPKDWIHPLVLIQVGEWLRGDLEGIGRELDFTAVDAPSRELPDELRATLLEFSPDAWASESLPCRKKPAREPKF